MTPEREAEIHDLLRDTDALLEIGSGFNPAATWHLANALRDLLRELDRTREALGPLVTICRDCRERPADFCMWGKLFPQKQLGFKCEDCARAAGVDLDRWALEQSAIIDCRPAREVLSGSDT